jgi:hypothetical protein
MPSARSAPGIHRLPRILPFAALLAAALAITAAPAAAFDLTGSYVGKFRCTGSFEGRKDSFAEPQVQVAITQSGNVFGMRFDDGFDVLDYSGVAIPDQAKPDKGEMAFVFCGTDDVLGNNGDLDEIGRLKVTTKPAKGTGKLSGTSIFTELDGTSVFTCKWTFKRVDTNDPGLPTSCM